MAAGGRLSPKPIESLAVFQQTILAALPPEAQPRACARFPTR